MLTSSPSSQHATLVEADVRPGVPVAEMDVIERRDHTL
jgi:hypothetical protein